MDRADRIAAASRLEDFRTQERIAGEDAQSAAAAIGYDKRRAEILARQKFESDENEKTRKYRREQDAAEAAIKLNDFASKNVAERIAGWQSGEGIGDPMSVTYLKLLKDLDSRDPMVVEAAQRDMRALMDRMKEEQKDILRGTYGQSSLRMSGASNPLKIRKQ